MEEHTDKRDRFGRRAELTKRQSDTVAWRKHAGVVKRAVLEAKRNSFEDFISQLDYKKDSLKVFKFVSNIQNRRPSCKKNPIAFGNKLLSSDKAIANAFGQFYSQFQRKGSYAKKMSGKVNVEWKKLFSLQKPGKESDYEAVFDAPFSAHELELALSRLKIKKIS